MQGVAMYGVSVWISWCTVYNFYMGATVDPGYVRCRTEGKEEGGKRGGGDETRRKEAGVGWAGGAQRERVALERVGDKRERGEANLGRDVRGIA
jgi:hypothetical protein